MIYNSFDERYLKLVNEFDKSAIPQMDTVKGINVGYKSESWGDEYIGIKRMNPENEPAHVKERLDAWLEACKNVE